MSSLVRVHELAKQYDPPNGVLAVDGVSFDIREGEIFGHPLFRAGHVAAKFE